MTSKLAAFQNALIVRNIIGRYASSKVSSTKKPLYGYDSESNAYEVDDYPYGFKLRCKARFWVEYAPKAGFRFCQQTENPKTGRWNKPKKSTYSPFGGCMYLDSSDHIQFEGVSGYDADKIVNFIEDFPKAEMLLIKGLITYNLKHYYGLATGKTKYVTKINGVETPESDDVVAENLGRYRKDLESWVAAAKKLKIEYHPAIDEALKG